mmetsp:Transcript_11359/g.19890  ORF Transcript_11359/g.19890 Transcript_11359/m.19890 type:complete len:232 (+) Transcript_11359:276-971(+)
MPSPEVVHDGAHLLVLPFQLLERSRRQLQGGFQGLGHHGCCARLLQIQGVGLIVSPHIRLDVWEVLGHGPDCAVVGARGVHGDDRTGRPLRAHQVQHCGGPGVTKEHRQVLGLAGGHALVADVQRNKGDEVFTQQLADKLPCPPVPADDHMIPQLLHLPLLGLHGLHVCALQGGAQPGPQLCQVGGERHGQSHHQVQLVGERCGQHAAGDALPERDERELAPGRQQQARAQ